MHELSREALSPHRHDAGDGVAGSGFLPFRELWRQLSHQDPIPRKARPLASSVAASMPPASAKPTGSGCAMSKG